MNGRKAYVLFALTLVYTFNYVDRQILVILAQPIKSEFGLKDWQLGFLTGTAFALLYATLGIPIARYADRWHRVNIIAAALVIWSGMTSLCAFTGSFAQLAAARIGVGIGEAGGSPPAVSLLADYFEPKQRSTAMGVYALGATLGILLGFGVGGWVNQVFGWRIAFLCAGLPGLVLAVLIKLTVPETRTFGSPATMAPVRPLRDVFRVLFSLVSYRRINVGAVAAGMSVYAFMVWMPQYLIRRFGLTSGEVGATVGLIAGIAGSSGIFLGGYLAERLSRRNPRWLLYIPAITSLLLLPMIWLALSAPTKNVAIAWLVPAYALALAYTGPVWSVLQNVTPADTRAMAAAILLFLVNLIGLGLGPQTVGIVSDLLSAQGGSNGLRTAIAAVCSVSLVASLYFYRTAKSLPPFPAGDADPHGRPSSK